MEKVNTIPVIYAGVKAPKRATEKEMKMMKKQVAAKKPMKKYAMGGGVLTEEQKINVSKGRAPDDGGTSYGGSAGMTQSAANAAAKKEVSNMTSGGGGLEGMMAGKKLAAARPQASPTPLAGRKQQGRAWAAHKRAEATMAKGGVVKGKKPAMKGKK